MFITREQVFALLMEVKLDLENDTKRDHKYLNGILSEIGNSDFKDGALAPIVALIVVRAQHHSARMIMKEVQETLDQAIK